MSDLRIEYMFLDEIQPAVRNPKLHDVDAIAASIDRHGFADPIILDERTQRLVAGHGTVEALALLWSTNPVRTPENIKVKDGRWQVPVSRGWASKDDDHAEAFILTHNQTTMRAGWDMPVVEQMLDDLALVDGNMFDEVGLTPLDVPPVEDPRDDPEEREPRCALADGCDRCGMTCPVLDEERSNW